MFSNFDLETNFVLTNYFLNFHNSPPLMYGVNVQYVIEKNLFKRGVITDSNGIMCPLCDGMVEPVSNLIVT